MMAALFLVFAISMVFVWKGQRRVAFVIALFNLVLCVLMLWHHATTVLQIVL